MDSIKKILQLDSENPPYKVIAYAVCALLVLLGIVLLAVGSTGAGVTIIMLALMALSVVVFKKQLKRFFNPTFADQTRDLFKI